MLKAANGFDGLRPLLFSEKPISRFQVGGGNRVKLLNFGRGKDERAIRELSACRCSKDAHA